MVNSNKLGTTGIIAMLLIVSLTAFLLPTVVGTIGDTDTKEYENTFTLSEGGTYSIEETNSSITANQINTPEPQYVNYTFNSPKGELSVELENDSRTNISIGDTTYQTEVTNIDVNELTATTKITYQTKANSLASKVWTYVPILIILVPILLLVGMISSNSQEI